MVLLLGAWPHLFALFLRPESRDAVLWITRGAVSNPAWARWVFLRDHFVGYRPVTALTYTFDSVVGGFAAFPYRATDLAVHLACAVALYVLVRRLAPKAPAWAGIAAAAWFVAHPIAAHVVPHLARRAYSLSVLFSALGLAVLAGPAGTTRTAAAAALLALGALSNEAGYAAFPAALAVIAARTDRPLRWRTVGIFAAVGAALVGIRLLVLGEIGGYAVDRGARAGSIVAALARGVAGADVLRTSTAPLPPWAPEIVTAVVLGGLAVSMVAVRREAPESAKAGAVGWVWLGTLVLLFATQGVFFPRQIYVLAAPAALLVGVAAGAFATLRWSAPRAALGVALVVGVFGVLRQSPVLLGPDPTQKVTWVRNDRLLSDLESAVADLERDIIVIPFVPYYARPEVSALRARSEADIPNATFEALQWVEATRDARFDDGIAVVQDAELFEPSSTLEVTPEGIEVTVPAGSEVVTQDRDMVLDVRSDGSRVFRPAPSRRARRTVLYFHDGVSGELVPVVETSRHAAPPSFPDEPTILSIEDDGDDGTLAGDTFHPDGDEGINRAARGSTVVLTFRVPKDLPASVVHARLDLPVIVHDDGPLELVIRGHAPTTTNASVEWTVPVPWKDPTAGLPPLDERLPTVCTPFQRISPDVAPIVEEALAQGAGVVSLSIDAVRGTLQVQDAQHVSQAECRGLLAPRLEVYPTLRSTFVAKELVGRPTDRTATLSVMSLVDVELSVETGSTPSYGRTTDVTRAEGGVPVHFLLDDLSPDAVTHYRVRARRPGASVWEIGPDRTLHTRRAPGGAFRFTVTSDSHHLNMTNRRDHDAMHLFAAVMKRVAEERPDFHLDLGDTFHTESYASYDASDDEAAMRRHLAVRPFFESVGAPVLVALGNHEGEQGWRIVAGDPVPLLATRTRKLLYPNPFPDGFYSGNEEIEPGVGRPENYYSFRWGDVLVAVIDPYRYTVRKPHDANATPGTMDPWDWTLGKTQADWLARTLEESHAPFELVFAHQLTGGVELYGRGGRAAAAEGDELESEWRGGNDSNTFAARRPGWSRPIHVILADAGVRAFVHGHDHRFVFEPPLDGVRYVTVPHPADSAYRRGFASKPSPDATVLPNSGHLLFEVEPSQLTMSYVRSFLPGDGPDGQVAFEHTWNRDAD